MRDAMHIRHFKMTQSAERFFEQKQGSGINVELWRWTLRSPGSVPPGALVEMAKAFDCEIGDLLKAGFGRLNKYDDIDEAVRNATGNELGEVAHVA